jgi:hypothetical protein
MKEVRQPDSSREKFFRSIWENRLTVALILVVQFGLHLLLYFNTETFSGISESGALFGKLDTILSGGSPKPLYGFYWYFTPAYIAAFFIRIFGSIDAYFVFQCLLATVTSLLIYFAVVKISGSKKSGVISIILTTIYTEFLLLSSVFYNQVYENFFVVLLLLVVLNFTENNSIKKLFIYGTLAIAVVLCSLMFRNTLLAAFFYFMLAGIFFLLRKRLRTGLGLMVLSIILFVLVFIIKPLDVFREGAYHPQRILEFWGHTPYGGNGGEVGFIFKENEELFNKRLEAYLHENNISEATPSAVEDFKSYEVRRFITKEPHRWLFLQLKKVLYTFGVMPQRDGLTMLVRGRAPVGWVTAAVLLQVPFFLILILFLLTVDIRPKDINILPGYKLLLYLLGLYLITGISIYATWAERYRIVEVVAFIIPVIAINIDTLNGLFKPGNRKELRIRLLMIAFMIIVWGYQAFEALVIHRDRYFQALERIG